MSRRITSTRRDRASVFVLSYIILLAGCASSLGGFAVPSLGGLEDGWSLIETAAPSTDKARRTATKQQLALFGSFVLKADPNACRIFKATHMSAVGDEVYWSAYCDETSRLPDYTVIVPNDANRKARILRCRPTSDKEFTCSSI